MNKSFSCLVPTKKWHRLPAYKFNVGILKLGSVGVFRIGKDVCHSYLWIAGYALITCTYSRKEQIK